MNKLLHKYLSVGLQNIYLFFKKMLTLIIRFFFLLLFISFLLKISLILIEFFYPYFNISNFTQCSMLPDGQPSETPSDPIRWWPAGVPQSAAIVGSALGVFTVLSKLSNCSPRLRVIGGLAAAGVSSTTVTYHSSIENSVGFHRFMFGLTTYQKTGQWPTLEEISKLPGDKLNDFVEKAMLNIDKSLQEKIISEVIEKINKGNKFIGDGYTDFINNLMDRFFYMIMNIVNPVFVEGYLDDLIGQQIIIHIILFISIISVFLLFIVFYVNIIFFINKDFLLSKFNNKYIKLYIRYQSFLAKLSLIYLPVFIFIGLLVITHGLYFLISHQIPYSNLGIDLHSYVTSSTSLSEFNNN